MPGTASPFGPFEPWDVLVYVDPMTARYNAANLDHGDAVTEPGYYVLATGEGPFEDEMDAMDAVPMYAWAEAEAAEEAAEEAA